MILRNFKEREFPESSVHAEPKLLYKLDDFRDYLNHPIYPSPVPGALARFDTVTSQHSAVDRKSSAIDFFCACDPFEVFIKLLESKLFKRIGIYFDTFFMGEPHVMFHVDLKHQDLMWFRDGGYYYNTQDRFYWELRSKFNQESVGRYIKKQFKK